MNISSVTFRAGIVKSTMGTYQDVVLLVLDFKVQLTCHHPEKLITRQALQIISANHDWWSKAS